MADILNIICWTSIFVIVAVALTGCGVTDLDLAADAVQLVI